MVFSGTSYGGILKKKHIFNENDAFLMKEYKLSNKEALEKVKKARPIVQPNSSLQGMVNQLQE